jgi:hypothetical protein
VVPTISRDAPGRLGSHTSTPNQGRYASARGCAYGAPLTVSLRTRAPTRASGRHCPPNPQRATLTAEAPSRPTAHTPAARPTVMSENVANSSQESAYGARTCRPDFAEGLCTPRTRTGIRARPVRHDRHVALLIRGKSVCRLCGEVLAEGQEAVLFPSGLFSRSDPAFDVNDAAVHDACLSRAPYGATARERLRDFLAAQGK